MLTKNIKFKNFLIKNKKKNISKKLKSLLSENNEILKTLSVRYKYSYTKKIVSKFKKYQNITLIGMGGSILGSQAIYDFIKHKIKKKVFFVNNLDSRFFKKKR